MCAPKLIVNVGKLAEKWVPKILGATSFEYVSITHPAAIIQADVSQQGLAIQRCLVILEDALAEL
jgi:uracil-DNA glycosylase